MGTNGFVILSDSPPRVGRSVTQTNSVQMGRRRWCCLLLFGLNGQSVITSH